MEEYKNVNLILDISLRHTTDGHRIIDVVKAQVREFIRESMINGEDSFYLYHPDVVELLYYRGDQVSAVGNYETEGTRFDIGMALKQSLYVSAAESDDYARHVFLVSDRLQPKDRVAVERFESLNLRDDINCHLKVIGIGSNYSRDLPFDYSHLENPALLKEMLKELCDGSNERSRTCGTQQKNECQDVCGKADEQCE